MHFSEYAEFYLQNSGSIGGSKLALGKSEQCVCVTCDDPCDTVGYKDQHEWEVGEKWQRPQLYVQENVSAWGGENVMQGPRVHFIFGIYFIFKISCLSDSLGLPLQVLLNALIYNCDDRTPQLSCSSAPSNHSTSGFVWSREDDTAAKKERNHLMKM